MVPCAMASNDVAILFIDKKRCYRKEDSASVVHSRFISLSALFSATYGLDIPDFSNWCLSRASKQYWSYALFDRVGRKGAS